MSRSNHIMIPPLVPPAGHDGKTHTPGAPAEFPSPLFARKTQRRAVGNQKMAFMPDYDDVTAVGSGQNIIGKNIGGPSLCHHAIVETDYPWQMGSDGVEIMRSEQNGNAVIIQISQQV